MLKGLSHVAVGVTDLDAALAFYKKIPGVEEQFRLGPGNGTVWLVYLKVGPSQFIELFPGSEHPYQANLNAGPVHLCLEVDDIHDMYKECVERGLNPDKEPRLEIDRAWQFWVHDPDGNPIEFHQFTADSMQLGG